MSVYAIEQATVYRVNGRRFLTQAAAIKTYALGKIRAKYPCECEPMDYPHYGGYDCGCSALRDKLLPRYTRRIKRCLKGASR